LGQAVAASRYATANISREIAVCYGERFTTTRAICDTISRLVG